jgi:ankyrin repeat protein
MSLADTPFLSPTSMLRVKPPVVPSIEEFHASLLEKLAKHGEESRSEYLKWSRGRKKTGGVRGLSTPEYGDGNASSPTRRDSCGYHGVSPAGFFRFDLADPKILVPAATQGDVDGVAAALANPLLESTNDTGNTGHTALTAAAANGHAEVVSALLADSRTNPHKRSNNRFSAMLWAATNGHAKVVRRILEDGRVDPNETTGFGRTALHLAASGGHAEVVRVLLMDGRADTNRTCKKGFTPFEVATEHMHLGVVNTLLADGRADQSSLKLRASPSLDEALGLGLSPMSPIMSIGNVTVSQRQQRLPLYHVA